MVNTPIPSSLKSEAKKASKILREFTMPNAKTGPDKLIPAGILAKAKGLAIITVFKAGFLVTARGGSGIVIAKLDEDSMDYSTGWSAPSAIGMAGLGGGFEIGAEVTDFVIILNTRAAITAFSKGGNLTLGGNFTVAAGPLGRNVEGDVSLRSPAAIYTYSKTKGIFAGISIEGSALIERKDANRKFYGRDIRASQILCGEVDPPDECHALYDVMKEHQKVAAKAALQLAEREAHKYKNKAEDRVMEEASSRYNFPNWRSRSKKSHMGGNKPSRFKSEWTLSQSSHDSSQSGTKSSGQGRMSPTLRTWDTSSQHPLEDSWSRKSSSSRLQPSKDDAWTSNRVISSKSTLSLATKFYDSDEDEDNFMPSRNSRFSSHASPLSSCKWVVAEHPYVAQLSCDLSFNLGDKLKVTKSSNTQDDWWEGLDSRGRQGIFPANFVRVVS